MDIKTVATHFDGVKWQSDDSFMAVNDTTNDSVLHSAFSSDLISEKFMKRIQLIGLMYII